MISPGAVFVDPKGRSVLAPREHESIIKSRRSEDSTIDRRRTKDVVPIILNYPSRCASKVRDTSFVIVLVVKGPESRIDAHQDFIDRFSIQISAHNAPD